MMATKKGKVADPEIVKFVQDKIQQKKVVLFARPSCKHCIKAEKTFAKYRRGGILKPGEFELVNINELNKGESILDYIADSTSSHPTVPKIYIKGRYIGGGDQLTNLDGGKTLGPLLKT